MANWVEQQGGLPSYIHRIVKHLRTKGMSESHAIATALNVAKRMCSSGDTNWPGAQHVNAGSRSEACAAVARWEQMKAASHAHAREETGMDVDLADIPAAERKTATSKGHAMEGGRFPIRNRADLQNAIRAVGRAKGGEQGRAAVRRYTIRRARELGASSLIPDTWASDGSLK